MTCLTPAGARGGSGRDGRRHVSRRRAGADGGLTAGYDPGAFFDEMFEAPGGRGRTTARSHERLAALSVEEFEERRRAVDASFLNQGIGFTVYGEEEGIERIFPFDLDPARDPGAPSGSTIERGLDPARARRSTSSSHDVYHDQRILARRASSRPSSSSARATSGAR